MFKLADIYLFIFSERVYFVSVNEQRTMQDVVKLE